MMKRLSMIIFALPLLTFQTFSQIVWVADTFQKNTIGTTWHAVTGDWRITDDRLVINTKEYDQLIAGSLYAPATTPYTIEVTAKGVRAGLMFGIEDAAIGKRFAQMVRFDDKSVITGYFNGRGEFTATNTFDIPKLPTDWTTLRVEIFPAERRYKIVVDGKEVGTDDRLVFPSGFVGLQASDGTAEFRSFRISGPKAMVRSRPPAPNSAVSFHHVRFVRSGRGNVVIYDPEQHAMLALDMNGRLLKFQPAAPPAADTAASRFGLRCLLAGGKLLIERSGTTDTVTRALVAPAAVRIDADSNVYVADPGANAILRYSPGGTLLRQYTARIVGGFLAPRGVDFSGKDEIVVADYDRLLFLPKSGKEQEPEVRQFDLRTMTVSWHAGSNSRGSVEFLDKDGARKTVDAALFPFPDPKTFTAVLKGVNDLTRYSYWVNPALKAIPQLAGRSRELRFTTLPTTMSQMAITRLPVMCMVYRTISYRDRYPKERYPQIPDGRTLTDDDLAYLRQGLDFNRAFYFRNSGCRFVLGFDFTVVEDTLWLHDLGDQDPYWLSSTERVANDFTREAQKLGKKPEQYAGIVVPYAWVNYPPRRTSALRDTSRGDTITIRQAYGGGTLGVPAPWRFGKTTGFTSNPFQDRFSRQDWLVTHEFQHQIDALLDVSGFPEYYHADMPWKMPGRFGEDFDFNAAIIRKAPAAWWLEMKFGTLSETGDADRDGVPDDDPSLPFDEKRLHGNPKSVDTDGDGLRDLQEVLAGTSHGTELNVRDTDGDGLVDGVDPEPLYAIAPVINRLKGGTINSTHNSFGTIETPELHATMLFGWDDSALVVGYQADRPATMLFQVDADADGWFHGFDNIQSRFSATNDSVAVIEYYLRDCSSEVDPPKDRKDILHNSDVRVAGSWQSDSTGKRQFVFTARIPRLDNYHLDLVPGKKIAVRFGLQTENDRWVWHELFERNYMMVVELQ